MAKRKSLKAHPELHGKTVIANGKEIKVMAAYSGIFNNPNSELDGKLVYHLLHDRGTAQVTEFKIKED